MDRQAGRGLGAHGAPPVTSATGDGGGGTDQAGEVGRRRRTRVVGLCLVAFVATIPVALTVAWLQRQFSIPDLLELLATVGTILASLYTLTRWVSRWIWQGDGIPRPAGGRRTNDPVTSPPGRFTVALVVLVTLSVVLAALGTVLVTDAFPDGLPEPRATGDACQRDPARDAIEVLVVWDDRSELGAFCDVVGAYISEYDRDVEVVSAGVDVGARLERRLARGDPPDVAILPQPSLVRGFGSRGELLPIGDIADRFPAAWNAFVTEQEGGRGPHHVFGAFVKGAHKSLFWYHPAELGNAVGIEPEHWTWDEFTTWIGDRIPAEPRIAPLTLAVRDEWPLTDWFENQLAGTHPEIYHQLAQRPEAGDDPIDWPVVRAALAEAFDEMADLWETPGLFLAGPEGEGVRGTTWQELASQLYRGDAAVMFGPSFLAGRVDAGQRKRTRLHPFGFPTLPDGRPLVVGGDVAVVPREAEDSVAGQAFVGWLTNDDATRRWSEADPGYLTPSSTSHHLLNELRPPDNEERVREYLTYKLRHPEDELHFDLSDDQLSIADPEDPHRNWWLFVQFFGDVVTGRVSRSCAVDRAVARFEAAYLNTAWPERLCGDRG